jgi:hypothetical protein
MTDDSLEILWRGTDPAKFTALQAALDDEDIPFWKAAVYDPSGGFLSSRPFYLELSPGFEIRVRAADFDRAQGALQWVESKETKSSTAGSDPRFEDDRSAPVPTLPFFWDAKEATSEAWSGEDESMAEYLASALRENGIPSRIPDDSDHRVRVCVRPGDVPRAREIVREVTEGPRPG